MCVTPVGQLDGKKGGSPSFVTSCAWRASAILSGGEQKEGTGVLVGQDVCFTCLSEKRVLTAGGRSYGVLGAVWAVEGGDPGLLGCRGPVEKRRSWVCWLEKRVCGVFTG